MRIPKEYRKFFVSFKKCIAGYCKKSNLHGFRNIAADNVKFYESVFWLLVCACGTLMTLVMFSRVWERFQKSPTMTTIETNNYPIKNVPFPAITMCNLNKVVKKSFDAISEKFADRGVEKWKFYKFAKQLPQIYSTRIARYEFEGTVTRAMNELGYSLESLMFDLSQPCSEFLVRCLWLGKDYDCSRLFSEVKSPEGFCCAFNWRGPTLTGYENTLMRKVEKEENGLFGNDENYVFVGDASTPLAGLTVVVDPDEANYMATVDSFFGSVVMLHGSFGYPDVDAPRAFVQPRSEAVFRLRANVIESSKNVRSLGISQRQCYFEEEVSFGSEVEYSYEACSLDCKLFTFFERCGCTPFYYPNLTNARTCQLSDMECIQENRVFASQDTGIATEEWSAESPGNHCRCLPCCNDVNYEWVMQGMAIRHSEFASPIFNGELGNRSAISFFFEQNVCIKYRMESLATWDSVIASFGGIFGLYLGGSIVSLIELLYYFAYEYWKMLAKRIEGEKKRKARKWAESYTVNARMTKTPNARVWPISLRPHFLH